jgi:nickel/cobalt transporter (NicO) family protein
MKRSIVGIALVAFFLAFAPSASAHPLGNFTANAFSRIQIDGTDVTLIYVLDLAEIPTFQLSEDLKPLRSTSLEDAVVRRLSVQLPQGVFLAADGAPVDLSLDSLSAQFVPGQGGLDTLRVDARFGGELPSTDTEISYQDRNYRDRVGWREIVFSGADGLGIAKSSVPSESISNGLRAYPKDLLSSPPRVMQASATLRPGASADGPSSPRGSGVAIDVLGDTLTSLVGRDLSFAFVLFALLLALGSGALHALGPGHGKTVMAAYLVGSGGRARHALAVGIAVSLMHTFSVVVLGLITLWASATFAPESVYPWLSFSSGVLVLGLGTWLLRARLRGRPIFGVGGQGRPHEHDGFHHHHDDGPSHHPHADDHGHSHYDHRPRDSSHARAHALGLEHSHGDLRSDVPLISRRGLGAIAVSGGLLPSPTALIVLLGAVALHRTAFGVALVGVFSVGLAAALTVIGLVVLKARDVVRKRSGSRLSRALPVVSAAAIVLVGLVLTTQAAVNLPL